MKKVSRKKKQGIKNTKVLVVAMIAVVLFIGVAYAALSATLTLTTSSVNSTGISWNVGFTPGTVNATKGGTSTNDVTCGTATVTANSVSVASTTLSKPDDSCTYALIIKNTGDIDAILGSVTPSSPSSTSCTTSGASMTCGNITYSLATSNSGTPLLATNTTLVKTTGTLNVYLIIKYTGTTVGDEISQANGKFTLVYNQA